MGEDERNVSVCNQILIHQLLPSFLSFSIGEFEDVDKSKIMNHDYARMSGWLKETALSYPNITSLYSAGKSTEGRDLWVSTSIYHYLIY